MRIAILMMLVTTTVHAASPPVPSSPQAAQQDVCVDVKIGNDHSQYYDCLNRQMRQQADRQDNQQQVTQAAVANSRPQSSTQMGLFNQAATHEQLGNAFGHSVVPQRPQQNYVNPLVH